MANLKAALRCAGPAVIGIALFVAASVVASAEEPAALTPSEQAAVAQMLDKVGSLFGPSLESEVVRLTKLYGDQNFNVKGILALVKAGAGNKQGAVTIALQKACASAPVGSVESKSYCDGATVASAAGDASGSPAQTAEIDVANIQTAAVGGGGGGGGGGGAVANVGTGTGNGTSGAGSSASSAGVNPTFSLSTSRSVSSSVGSSSGGGTYYIISTR